MIGIYKITNKHTNWSYIGSSKSIENRWKQHVRELEENNHHCYRLQYDWNKYGIVGFDFCVLEICDEEELISKEQYHIDENYNDGKIYNTKLQLMKNNNISNSIKTMKNKKVKTIHIPKGINYKNIGINGERVLIYILNKVVSSEDKYIEVSVKEYCKETNTVGKNIYAEFIKYVDDLRETRVNNNNMFEECEYNQGILVATISDEMLRYINNNKLDLSFNISDINKITCSKTIKLLIYLLQGNRKISISQIRDILDIPKSKYTNYSNLKSRIIDSIVDDFCKIGIKVDIEEVKEGRKVKYIVVDNI